MADTTTGMMQEVVQRIRELRQDCGYTEEQMSEFTGFSVEDYRKYESGAAPSISSIISTPKVMAHLWMKLKGRSASPDSYLR